MLKCTSIFFLVSIFVIHALGEAPETISPRMSPQDQRAATERNKAREIAKKTKGKADEENSKKQEEYNKLANDLNTKNKQITEYFTQIKNCETSRYKNLESQFASCGGKSIEQYTNEKKALLNYAVKSQVSIKSKYDDFLRENSDSTAGKFKLADIVDTTDAMKYYANPNSENQSAVNSDSGANPQSTLEQRVGVLEKKIDALSKFIKKNIGENKESVCQKVSSCPQIVSLKENVKVLNTFNGIDSQEGGSRGGAANRPPPPPEMEREKTKPKVNQ